MAAKLNHGFRVGTSSRRVSRYSLPSKPGVGPRYIVIPRDVRVLVVEDLWDRQYTFLTRLGSKATKIVSRADAAIKELQRDEPYQWIMLDYDLGFGRTSEAVARRVVGMGGFTGFIVIHPTNPFGAAMLEQILRDGGISKVEVAPFDILGVFREQ